jgi:hypothetical protein
MIPPTALEVCPPHARPRGVTERLVGWSRPQGDKTCRSSSSGYGEGTQRGRGVPRLSPRPVHHQEAAALKPT